MARRFPRGVSLIRTITDVISATIVTPNRSGVSVIWWQREGKREWRDAMRMLGASTARTYISDYTSTSIEIYAVAYTSRG